MPAGGASTEAGSGAQPSVDKSASSAPTSGGEGRKVGEPEEHDATKPVFTEKEHVTGEEEEETLHQVKCKLYAMSEGQWAERGMGPIRLNQTVAKGDKHGARLGESCRRGRMALRHQTLTHLTLNSDARRCDASPAAERAAVPRFLDRGQQREIRSLHGHRGRPPDQLHAQSEFGYPNDALKRHRLTQLAALELDRELGSG